MSDQYPPEGYIPAVSAIEGIEVYMPAPPQMEDQAEIVEFNCPQCGATTAYNAKDGGLKCDHCGYYELPEKDKVGTMAKSREFTFDAMEQAKMGWGEPRKELECQKCGAKTTVPMEMLAHTCAFCGSNQVIQRDASQDSIKPQFVIPFKVDSQQCSMLVKRWLGSSWMTPAGLGKLSGIQAFTGVYLPFWAFDSITNAEWEAEVGHAKTERYYDAGSKEWKTRTVIEWRWESGQVHKNFNSLLVIGTQKLSALLISRIDNFRIDELAPYEAKYLAGLQARGYDIPLETAWETGRNMMREQTRKVCREQASSSQIRNFSMTLDFDNEGWQYLLLPTYVAAYSYRGDTYQVIVNGQTGDVAGQRPVDWQKIWLVIAAFLAPGLLASLIGIITLPLGGFGALIAGVGFILLLIGLAISIWIGFQAQKMDDA